MMDAKEVIARKVASMLKDGDFVNLGIGIPTLVPNYLSAGVEVVFQSENGMVMAGPTPEPGKEDPNLTNAGGQPVTIQEGGAFFDSATSFMFIRGGHVDYTVLGALEVDEKGNLSNWIVPGKMVPGMGGAMDLVAGAKKVVVAMTHTQKGEHKILKACSLPYTAVHEVDYIVTEMGFMVVTDDGIVLKEYNPEYTIEQIQEATGCKLIIDKDIKPMAL